MKNLDAKVENISSAVLLIGLAVLAFLQSFWPGMLIVLGIYYSVKNALLKNYPKVFIYAILFPASFVCVQFPWILSWNLLLPMILLALGCEKLLKGLFNAKSHDEMSS